MSVRLMNTPDRVGGDGRKRKQAVLIRRAMKIVETTADRIVLEADPLEVEDEQNMERGINEALVAAGLSPKTFGDASIEYGSHPYRVTLRARQASP